MVSLKETIAGLDLERDPSGEWRLYLEPSEEMAEFSDGPSILLTGPAKWDDARKSWDRPNLQDYAIAGLLLARDTKQEVLDRAEEELGILNRQIDDLLWAYGVRSEHASAKLFWHDREDSHDAETSRD
jgi:hypothetical protein